MVIDLSPLRQSDAEVMETARKLRTAYEMKRTMRYRTERDHSVHSESDAEHVFGLLFLSAYFLPFEDPESRLDVVKVHHIICFHDFPELKYGDIPTHFKTVADEERESLAAQEIFAALPQRLGKLGFDSWAEYEERLTPEAKFVYALDKIEPVFELFDPVNEKSCKRVQITYERYMDKKAKSTKNFPAMRRFLDVISADMRRRGIFWTE